MQSPIERLKNLSDLELIDLADALAHWCPNSCACVACPLYDGSVYNPGVYKHDEPNASCLCIAADLEYFSRHNSHLH